MEIYQTSRPYDKMRNGYVGDYLYHPGVDLFRFIIAEMPTDYQALVFLHEFTEAYLCWKNGIEETDISAFDEIFESERAQGLHGTDDEPGDDPRAPYYDQHQIATEHERKFAEQLGVDLDKYDDFINNIGE